METYGGDLCGDLSYNEKHHFRQEQHIMSEQDSLLIWFWSLHSRIIINGFEISANPMKIFHPNKGIIDQLNLLSDF